MGNFSMILLGLALFLTKPALASNNDQNRWLEGNADGWFWYDDPGTEPELNENQPEPAKIVIQSPPVATGPAPLSSAWIRENIQSYLDSAIDNPTPENVSAFLYIQRYAMDKSFAFMDAQQQATLGHPVFDEINRRPTATFANRKLDESASGKQKSIITKISRHSGLFLFLDGSEASIAQLQVINLLQRNQGFDLVKIAVSPLPPALKTSDVRFDSGHSEMMGVTSAPSVVLVRSDGVFDVISQAPVSLADLEKRLLMGAKRLAIISDEEFNSTRPIANIGGNLKGSPRQANAADNLPIAAKDIITAFSGVSP